MDKVNNISYASSQSLGDRPNQQDAYLTLTKNNDTCVSHTSQNGTPRHQHGGR